LRHSLPQALNPNATIDASRGTKMELGVIRLDS